MSSPRQTPRARRIEETLGYDNYRSEEDGLPPLEHPLEEAESQAFELRARRGCAGAQIRARRADLDSQSSFATVSSS